MKRNVSIFMLLTVCMLLLTACARLDVIGTGAISSFGEVIAATPESVQQEPQTAGYAMTAPDGAAKFVWSLDESAGISLELDATPFIDAGLDASKLPEGMLRGVTIVISEPLSERTYAYQGDSAAFPSFEQIVRQNAGLIGYHAAMDHFGIGVGDGNLLEWAKDMNANDKDIVFVLNPEPFIDAGVNPEGIDGWIFGKVETMDAKGKMITVDKLLKPFDIL